MIKVIRIINCKKSIYKKKRNNQNFMFQKKEVIKNNFLNSDNAILHRRMIEITIHFKQKIKMVEKMIEVII